MSEPRGVFGDLRRGLLFVFVLALVTGAATASAANRDPRPSGGSASGRGPLFAAAGLALCERTDLAPLAGLSLRVRESWQEPAAAAPGTRCRYTLATPDGHRGAVVHVSAVTPATAGQAVQIHDATAAATSLPLVGPVAVGQQATAFARAGGWTVQVSQYLICARSGNLVVTVWLKVFGRQPTPVADLAEAVRALTAATLAVVPPA
jgi:hypothetical protein